MTQTVEINLADILNRLDQKIDKLSKDVNLVKDKLSEDINQGTIKYLEHILFRRGKGCLL